MVMAAILNFIPMMRVGYFVYYTHHPANYFKPVRKRYFLVFRPFGFTTVVIGQQ